MLRSSATALTNFVGAPRLCPPCNSRLGQLVPRCPLSTFRQRGRSGGRHDRRNDVACRRDGLRNGRCRYAQRSPTRAPEPLRGGIDAGEPSASSPAISAIDACASRLLATGSLRPDAMPLLWVGNGTQRGHQPPHTAPEGGSTGRQLMQGQISHTPKFWTGGLRGRSRIQPSATGASWMPTRLFKLSVTATSSKSAATAKPRGCSRVAVTTTRSRALAGTAAGARATDAIISFDVGTSFHSIRCRTGTPSVWRARGT